MTRTITAVGALISGNIGTSTVVADRAPTALRQPRVRLLRAELAEITADRAMAARFHASTTGGWLAELAAEERDCWEHIADACTCRTV